MSGSALDMVITEDSTPMSNPLAGGTAGVKEPAAPVAPAPVVVPDKTVLDTGDPASLAQIEKWAKEARERLVETTKPAGPPAVDPMIAEILSALDVGKTNSALEAAQAALEAKMVERGVNPEVEFKSNMTDPELLPFLEAVEGAKFDADFARRVVLSAEKSDDVIRAEADAIALAAEDLWTETNLVVDRKDQPLRFAEELRKHQEMLAQVDDLNETIAQRNGEAALSDLAYSNARDVIETRTREEDQALIEARIEEKRVAVGEDDTIAASENLAEARALATIPFDERRGYLTKLEAEFADQRARLYEGQRKFAIQKAIRGSRHVTAPVEIDWATGRAVPVDI
jgi:hypothetical protein